MRRAVGAALGLVLAAMNAAMAQVPRDPLEPSTAPRATSAGQPQLPAPYVTKQNDVEIPFNVRPGTSAENQPSSVRVFVSWDRGKNWHFYEEKKAEVGRFRFRAKQDGEFWFATQTVDRSGRADSSEPRRPQLRLIIDTQRPTLLVQAHATTSANVNLSWSAADATLIPGSLKLEYQDAGVAGAPWQAIELNAPATSGATTLNGQTSFQPVVSSRAITLRAEVADSAGNMAYHSQRLSLTPSKPKEPAGGIAFDPAATRWTPATSSSTSERQLAADVNTPGGRGDSEQVRIPGIVENPFAGPGRLASSGPSADPLPPPTESRGAVDAWSGSSSPELPRAEAAPRVEPLPSAGVADLPPAAAPVPMEVPPMASPNLSPAEVMPTPLPLAPLETVEPTTSHRPRLTNSRRFSLEYDLQSVGPEGVAAVELWGTNDNGRAWTKWGTDADKASPFDVEVNREAVYGFRIVVVGKNGLATATPQSGDAADIWVSVDLTRPQAKFTGATYGQGAAAGKLDIRWQADDANLGSRGVTLLMSDRPDGRFTPIATGLPNTGQYFWEYDPRSPRQIFLRLEVRDDAGNVAIDQLAEPIKVEGLEPKGQIRGFKPAGENNRGSYRSPVLR